MAEEFLGGKVVLHCGDSRDVLKGIPDESIDSVVCDPPYALVSIGKRFGRSNMEQNPDAQPPNRGAQYKRLSKGFMGKQWDTGETAFAAGFWAEVLRVLKPGGHVVAFSGTRTYHRMACAIEDAGFEIRDQLAWLYGSGFPKSHDVSKGIDRAKGLKRPVVGTMRTHDITGGNLMESSQGVGQGNKVLEITGPASPEAAEWEGWGTALKPAWEPICFGRKPIRGTVAANVLMHGTGAINIDGTRIGDEVLPAVLAGQAQLGTFERDDMVTPERVGRYPANIIHDGSAEVVAGFPDQSSGGTPLERHSPKTSGVYGEFQGSTVENGIGGSAGSASRFFYTAKADGDDRLGSKHPTVKPVDLMQWLCRLVTPPGGTVLDPFAGTGSTGEAAFCEGFNAVLIEREAEYQDDIRRRMGLVISSTAARKKAANKAPDPGVGGMFAGLEPEPEPVAPSKNNNRSVGPVGLKKGR